MEKKDILCPDCGLNVMTTSNAESFGKCFSCHKRESMAIRNNIPYIKFKDLQEEEKVRILRQREIKKTSAKKIRKQLKDEKNVEVKVKKAMKQMNGRNRIYTPDIIDQIKSIATEQMSKQEILSIIQSLYPDKDFTLVNLNNVIVRHHIPHCNHRGRIKTINDKENLVNVADETIENIDDTLSTTLDIKSDSLLIDNDKKTELVEINSRIDFYENINNEIKVSTDNVESDRFKPIYAEIDSILDTQFKKAGCVLQKDYTTKDYINMLETLIYVVENGQDIIKYRKQQQNIMNAYQSDMIHEMENTIAKTGDTYLSDKMHVIRNYRRHFESDYRDIATLRPLRESVNLDMLKSILTNMKKNLQYIENPMFKPLVDTTLVDKYDWAYNLDSNSAKAKISVINYNPNDFNKNTINSGRPVIRIGMSSNTPPTSQLNAKTRKSLHIYRVSCKISGGGYGVYKQWYRDYECTNPETAKVYATNTLNRLASTKPGMMWTNLEIIEINTKSIPSITPNTST